MECRVLDFLLPNRLSRLIEAGGWHLTNETKFSNTTGIPANDIGLRFLLPNAMRVSTKSIRKLAYAGSASYSLIFPLALNKNSKSPELLNTYKCLIIVHSMNENYVVLDYRCSNEPEVRATVDEDGKLIHKLVAKTFDDFADAIGLPDPANA